MARFKEADARLFDNVWVCRKCKVVIRGKPGEKPRKCRKCNSKDLRLKHKARKAKSK